MSEAPRYGQRAPQPRREACPRHPDQPAVAYCKRCNRPACVQCAIQTEVGSVCVDCAGRGTKRSRFSAAGSSPWSRGGQTAARPARTGGTPGWVTSAKNSPVTATLIGINVLLFIVQYLWSPLFQYLAFTPQIGTVQPYRMLTTTFLHAGFFHLLFNMLMLAILGNSIERAFGWWRYLAIYLLSALGGSVAIVGWVLAQPGTWVQATVGASGAIYGLFGAIFVAQRRAGMSTTSIVILLVVNLIYGFTVPGISWQAHIGGFVAGLLVSSLYLGVFDWTRGKSVAIKTTWAIIATVAMLAALAGLTWLFYALVL